VNCAVGSSNSATAAVTPTDTTRYRRMKETAGS
jgi:hypothetical protein